MECIGPITEALVDIYRWRLIRLSSYGGCYVVFPLFLHLRLPHSELIVRIFLFMIAFFLLC